MYKSWNRWLPQTTVTARWSEYTQLLEVSRWEVPIIAPNFLYIHIVCTNRETFQCRWEDCVCTERCCLTMTINNKSLIVPQHFGNKNSKTFPWYVIFTVLPIKWEALYYIKLYAKERIKLRKLDIFPNYSQIKII